MKKFYVASSLNNKEAVRSVSEYLVSKGYIHTYDWTRNESVSSLEQLREIGQAEKDAVLEADFLIVLLPGGKGTHIEFGIALGQGKQIYLYSETEEINEVGKTSTFYHLPQVEKIIGSVDQLLESIDKTEQL